MLLVKNLTQGEIDMAKLVVWIAVQEGDHACYNLLAKTKKACLELIAQNDRDWIGHNPSGKTRYDAPKKREIVYKDAFDLFYQATSEGGGRGW
jgi:hypothetical protein